MRIIILIVLVISALTAVACSSEVPSTAEEQPASRPTADVPATVEAGIRSTREAETAVEATVEAKVAATLTITTSTPGPTNTPAATTLSLDEYLTLCATTEQELADDATYGDLSSLLAAEADRFEALTPPAQLAEWHLLNIEAYRTAQAVFDTQPKDDVMDFDNPTMNAAGDDFEEKLREAAAGVPEDVLQQMIEASCIDPDYVPDDYENVPDDHGNYIGDATVAAVGAVIGGVIEHEDDSDYFRFTAEEGQLYQIDVALGSLDDSVLSLWDPDAWELAYNDDHGGSRASRVFWEAPTSRDYYLSVEASGFDGDVGTYTLIVSYSSFVDDHGNYIGDATMAAVGASVGGVIDYEGDSDYFRFTAEEGQLYQIDVALGSLPDSYLELLDSNGWDLAYNDDHGDSPASRVVWEALASGDYYLAVEASVWDAQVGSYALTVSHSTIVDDHGNNIDDATVAAVGAAVGGVIDYEDDSDYFHFIAEEGQLYQIDVALGTLPDSVLSVLGPDGLTLAYNDDHGDSRASRAFWDAPASGDYYLVVGGYGAGSYSLTVTRR